MHTYEFAVLVQWLVTSSFTHLPQQCEACKACVADPPATRALSLLQWFVVPVGQHFSLLDNNFRQHHPAQLVNH